MQKQYVNATGGSVFSFGTLILQYCSLVHWVCFRDKNCLRSSEPIVTSSINWTCKRLCSKKQKGSEGRKERALSKKMRVRRREKRKAAYQVSAITEQKLLDMSKMLMFYKVFMHTLTKSFDGFTLPMCPSVRRSICQTFASDGSKWQRQQGFTFLVLFQSGLRNQFPIRLIQI